MHKVEHEMTFYEFLGNYVIIAYVPLYFSVRKFSQFTKPLYLLKMSNKKFNDFGLNGLASL